MRAVAEQMEPKSTLLLSLIFTGSWGTFCAYSAHHQFPGTRCDVEVVIGFTVAQLERRLSVGLPHNHEKLSLTISSTICISARASRMHVSRPPSGYLSVIKLSLASPPLLFVHEADAKPPESTCRPYPPAAPKEAP